VQTQDFDRTPYDDARAHTKLKNDVVAYGGAVGTCWQKKQKKIQKKKLRLPRGDFPLIGRGG